MTSHLATAKKAPTEPPPKPPCKIHSLAIIADRVQITGSHSVEIGENTILHPYAKIKAEGGRVVIGSNCAISEKAVVGIAEGGEGDVIIGDDVDIETAATVEAYSVGDGTIVETGAMIGKGAVIGKHCKIAPLEEVGVEEELADFTVVYSHGQRRLDQTMSSNDEVRKAKLKNHMAQLELLKKLIPDASAKWR